MPYIDKINYKGTEYDLQDTALKEDLDNVVEDTHLYYSDGNTLVTLYDRHNDIKSENVTVTDNKGYNSSGNFSTISSACAVNINVNEGDIYYISGRLGNYSIVTFNGSAISHIYLIAEIGEDITTSGIGTYNQDTKSFTNWKLTISANVTKLGITYANVDSESYSPILKKQESTYVPVNVKQLKDDLEDIEEDVSDVTATQTSMLQMPITNMPLYLKNILAYKPVGKLTKPYICLSTDDGREGLIHQTIEMVVAEANVPVTFCIHSRSDIFYSAKLKKYTSAQVATAINDAINTYGCELALHDNKTWADGASSQTAYTEKTLYEFVQSEQEFFANPYDRTTDTPFNMSWPLKSASAPEHLTDQIVCAIMGGIFGSLRSGDTTRGPIKNLYDYKCIGTRSNLYCMPCKNFNSGMYNTLQKCKDAVDYAVANNLILPIFWHEAIMEDATTESTSNEHISDTQISDLLLPAIEYAKGKGVEFVTLSQIQNIT